MMKMNGNIFAANHLTRMLLRHTEMMWRMMMLLLLVVSVGAVRSGSITVATYNIWNVMFNWDVRKHHIAEMIRASNIDLISLQEVRGDEDRITPGRRRWTQVDELQQLLLPEYKWSTFQTGHTVTPPKDGILHEWQLEGLALLSKHPILHSRRQELSHHSRQDKIRRKVLHVTLRIQDQDVVVSVVHLSYDKWQQCNNVAEIMQYVRDTKPKYSIILGDFNTYNDYEGPLEGLHKGYFPSQNKCPKYAKSKNPTVESELTAYDDVWRAARYGEDGFTFSNMPSPGLVSRPDRILVSNRYIKVRSASLKGYGQEYARSYQNLIRLKRQEAVLQSAKGSSDGTQDGRCSYDCGPNGSCRCGVCVGGGNDDPCEAPDCSECDASLYHHYRIIKVMCWIFTLQLFVAFVQIALCLNHRRSALNGCRTFAKDVCQVPLVKTLSYPSRSHIALCLSSARRSCSCFTLMNLCIGLMGILSLLCLSRFWFEDALRLIDNALPEEFNPSDHLMVIAEVELI